MSDLEKVLKDVVYGSVGAVASAIEAGSDLARVFVKKGAETIQKGSEMAEEARKSFHEACMKATGIDVRSLSRAQRDALRRDLESMLAEDLAAAAKEAAEKAAKTEERAPVMDIPDEEDEAEAEETMETVESVVDDIAAEVAADMAEDAPATGSVRYELDQDDNG